eukprot:TRINITY_DN5102_c0_g1_i2.p1 TRINITY_DN5102_c0_g1~~TRINITY_DN5102_c0_g1_i2.p1  ORF type:complete len:459 (-),score=68.05 TRINITY_DN5102_c0_g1_i2:167-1543(-)
MNWTLPYLITSMGTASEGVAIADIDLDGVADIINIGNPLKVFNSNDSWAGARNAWSLHSHNSENIDQNDYPQVTTASNIFRNNPIYHARAEITSVSIQNCFAIVETLNVGLLPLRPSSLCVASSTGNTVCNTEFVNPGNSFVASFSISQVLSGTRISFSLSNGTLSKCSEDLHSQSIVVNCPSQSPVVFFSSQSPSPSETKAKSSSTPQSTKSKGSATATVAATTAPATLRKIACVGCEVLDTSFTFDKESAAKDKTIPFRVKGNKIAGSLTIPANTFDSGCTIIVRQSDEDADVQDSNALDCKPELKLSSVAVELTIEGGKNCSSKHFRNSVLLDLYSEIVDTNDACAAFKRKYKDSWKCLDSKKTRHHDHYISIRSKTDHFTTFAVLFQSSNPCDRWIWITSLSMVACCLVFILWMGIWYWRSKHFRALIGGFHGESVSGVIEKVNKKTTIVSVES